ncbi:hypothetical protein BKP45_07775 [Anaerobacillus alkalidiazotrophicus]|uniref:Uncharacterized protein n=1 Tax=Anaerobacillus alkalidiazotrophicus TaxID=472963 RepID=A0A1S2M826_9BACI|nr:hypothetical protein [Anaerobacillus alkalidiazotrophicus]OIJ20898.1 hypothetical protein BKP45_07775 [Anaerobacillus alkalidiazotrophicus]
MDSLILNYDWLNRIESSLFKKLNNAETRNNYLNNPSKVILDEFYEEIEGEINLGKVSSENLLMFDLLQDRAFLDWNNKYTKRINEKLNNVRSSPLYVIYQKNNEVLEPQKIYTDTINAIFTESNTRKQLNLYLLNNHYLNNSRQIPNGSPEGIVSVAIILVVAAAAAVATAVVAFSVKIVHPTFPTIDTSVRVSHPVSVRLSLPVSFRVSHPVALRVSQEVSVRFTQPHPVTGTPPSLPRTEESCWWMGLDRENLKLISNLMIKVFNTKGGHANG